MAVLLWSLYFAEGECFLFLISLVQETDVRLSVQKVSQTDWLPLMFLKENHIPPLFWQMSEG